MRIATLSSAAVGHTRHWVAWFRARGHEVEVWSLEPGPAELCARALPSASLPGFARYPLAVGALRRELATFDPELVDAHFVPNYGLLGALAGRHPLVVSAWGSDLLVLPRRGALQRARARFVLARADAVVADSGNLAAAARALGAPPSRVHEIPWGVDLERFADRAIREDELLVSTRMHEPIYDLETLIEGVRPVLERRPRARLVVIGDGSRRAALEALAARRLPPGRCTFVGLVSLDEMAQWLARAAVYLSAARSDSTSLSLLEAMASGALPVVSDIEGNREWVEHGAGAALFPPGDATALATALERALEDPAWMARARALNRRRVEERGDRGANMARIEQLFMALAAPRGSALAPGSPA